MSADAVPRTFALAITGASGALYAMRTMAALLERECHLEVVISDYGRRLLHDELGEQAAVPRLRDYLVDTYGESASKGTFEILSNSFGKAALFGEKQRGCVSQAFAQC